MPLRDRILDPNWDERAEAWCARHPVLCKLAHLAACLVLLGLLVFVLLPRLARAG